MKKIGIFLFFLLFAFVGIILYHQQKIMQPIRRVLEPYHYEWLKYPQKHSMKIEKINGVLIVQPNQLVPNSIRSQKIKDELEEMGFSKESLVDNGILLMYHGKNGRKEDLLPVAERYVSAGFICLLVDLPAHGENSQEVYYYGQGLERYLYDETLKKIEKKVNLKNRNIFLWGMSLGGAYAITSAMQDNKREFQAPKALILVSTFDNLSSVLKEKAKDIFGSYMGEVLYKGLGFSLKTFYQFNPEKVDSKKNAHLVDIPLFMFHGKEDRLISYRHGQELFKSFPNPNKVFHLAMRSNHHNILVGSYPFYKKSIVFLLTID